MNLWSKSISAVITESPLAIAELEAWAGVLSKLLDAPIVLAGSALTKPLSECSDLDVWCLMPLVRLGIFGQSRDLRDLLNMLFAQWLIARMALPVDFQFWTEAEASGYQQRLLADSGGHYGAMKSRADNAERERLSTT